MLSRIEECVSKYPDRIAYKVNDESITYQELWDKAASLANLLQRQDTSPVIIYGHKQMYVIISIIACLIAKRCYVPVDISSPKQRVVNILKMTHSSLVITEESIIVEGVECCNIKQLSKYKEYEIKNCNSEIVYMIFTSGSTGEPKGVPIYRENLNNFIHWISHLYPLSTYHNEVVFNQASFSFDLSVADFYYSICNGHTLVAYNNQEYNDLFKLFNQEHISIAVMTPTFIKLFLLNEDFNSIHYPDFKCVYFCGERLENKTAHLLLDRFPDLKIINAYGPTEATSAISAIVITPDLLQEEVLPVGEISTLATPVEIIEDEIVLKGPSVFHGYLGSQTGGYIQENGEHIYKTGDIGYIENNKLYCKGRKDSQVKYKGYRIELLDIENNISHIQGVRECVVVAKYNEVHIVKTIKAFVLVEEGITVSYIKEQLSTILPDYMMPKSIKILEKFPVNQNGKTDRKAMSNL